ncbi:conserved protein of unknown function [Tenacibaculum sp. 190524A02b]
MNTLIAKMDKKKADLFIECLKAYKSNKFIETDIEAIFLLYDKDECQIELTSSRDILSEVFTIGEHVDIRFDKLN